MKVVEVMDENITTIRSDVSIGKAIERILEENIHFFVVMDGEESVGVLTVTDCLDFYLNNDHGKIVEDYMTPHILYISEDKELKDAAKFFKKSKVDNLPVVEELEGERNIIGILNRFDVLQAFRDVN
ncbi:MAG: CBS domain containing protein [Candidatus Methanohalarchaeum thermophilum]|uniref:CBS domain containing protein n=1 Tax=Methanohalarchaeum thermophilum TaxID=1903181 RepID=A0A1Q6DUX7_METT1|nr:MAG: CBS domain containing protein [Candidatus Methanohalarchaeum thermophilum]